MGKVYHRPSRELRFALSLPRGLASSVADLSVVLLTAVRGPGEPAAIGGYPFRVVGKRPDR
jgi:hypothetical protein